MAAMYLWRFGRLRLGGRFGCRLVCCAEQGCTEQGCTPHLKPSKFAVADLVFSIVFGDLGYSDDCFSSTGQKVTPCHGG